MEEKNLTKEMRLVVLAPDLEARPGHELVIFEQNGKKQPQLLGPGENPKRIWLRRKRSILAYWVPRGRPWRHAFSRPCQTVDQIHTFTLRYRLDFAISDSICLVERLSDDPLRQLEDEVDSLLGGTARRMPWESLEREDADVCRHLLSALSYDDEPTPNFDRLRNFACDLGLDLKNIGVTRNLPEANITVVAGVIKQKQTVLETEHELKMREMELKQEEELLAKKGTVAEARIMAIKRGIDAAAGAIERIAEHIEDPQGLVNGARGIVESVQTLNALRVSDGGRSEREFSPELKKSIGDRIQTSNQLNNLLTEITEEFSRLTCESREKRRLTSFALHLVAEALLVEEGDSELIGQYTRVIHDVFTREYRVLSNNQKRLFQRLQNVNGLQDEFSREAP